MYYSCLHDHVELFDVDSSIETILAKKLSLVTAMAIAIVLCLKMRMPNSWTMLKLHVINYLL